MKVSKETIKVGAEGIKVKIVKGEPPPESGKWVALANQLKPGECAEFEIGNRISAICLAQAIIRLGGRATIKKTKDVIGVWKLEG